MNKEELDSIQELIERKILLAEVSGGLTSSDKKFINLWNYTIELQDNWNKLKEWLEEEITTIKNNFSQVNGNYFMMNDRIEVLEDVLEKLQEIEGGMNDRRL